MGRRDPARRPYVNYLEAGLSATGIRLSGLNSLSTKRYLHVYGSGTTRERHSAVILNLEIDICGQVRGVCEKHR